MEVHNTGTTRGPKTCNNKSLNKENIKNISIFYTNCDTLTNKLEELEILTNEIKPDVIMLTEIAPKFSRYKLQKSEIQLKGYNIHTNVDTKKRENRGVAIYIKKKINAIEVKWRGMADDTIWIEINLKSNKKMVIGCVYRSSSNNREQNLIFLNTLKKASEKYKENLLIVGDCNCKEINWEDKTTNIVNLDDINNMLLNTIRDCYFQQSVDECTRARGQDTPSLIDLVLSYDKCYIQNIEYLSPIGLSDHSVISFDYVTHCELNIYKIKKTLYHKANFDIIRPYIEQTNWDVLFRNKTLQEKWDIFDCKIKECEKFIPTVNIDQNRESKYEDMLPTNIRQQIKKKHKLWKRYIKHRDMNVYKEFRKTSNKVKNMTTYCRKQKEKNISMNVKNNPKAFWKYVKSKTKITSSIAGLHTEPTDSNSGITNDDTSKANILNNYFASVFTKEPLGDIPVIDSRTNKQMQINYIEKNEVEVLLNNLDINKSPSPDGYHPRLLKELHKEISEPLTNIFNSSISEGKIPFQWKQARVSAIHKKGDKKLASNYRPVSITSIVCRILEKIIRNYMVEYLTNESLISIFQFGFIKGRSTSLQLLNILNDWTNSMEKKYYTDCIYLDYQKAFDTVPHRRLIDKLKSYNFDIKIINWIEFYLSDRIQYVEINGIKSEYLTVSSGIPQGSVIGPLLFLLYINDLPDTISSTIYMYADDTKVYREIKSSDDNKLLQNDLNIMCKWSDTWLLKFHPNKCNSIAIGNNEVNHKYMLNNDTHTIEQVTEIKDIGVIIDSELTFKQHIYKKIDTANSILGIIRRSYKYIDINTFLPLYKGLVRSHFDYAATIWDPYIATFIEDIESVQRRATILIPEIKHLNYPERLEKLKLPTLAYRRARGEMIEVYKIMNSVYDNRVTQNLLTKRNKNIHMQLRGHELILEQKRIYNRKVKNFFSNRVVKLWNTLPYSIITVVSLNAFKNKLDKLWSNQELLTNHRSAIDANIYPKCCKMAGSQHLDTRQ